MSSATNSATPYTIAIEGMTCGHCIKAVTQALAGVPGVHVRSVALGTAEIAAPDGLTVAAAVNALSDAGYTASVAAPTSDATKAGRSGVSCCGGPANGPSSGRCCS